MKKLFIIFILFALFGSYIFGISSDDIKNIGDSKGEFYMQNEFTDLEEEALKLKEMESENSIEISIDKVLETSEKNLNKINNSLNEEEDDEDDDDDDVYAELEKLEKKTLKLLNKFLDKLDESL